MYKVGVCGHFGSNKEFLDGQTVKTKILTRQLQIIFGDELVATVDTYNWRNKTVKLVVNCIKLIKNCENIIILPAHNGVKIFVPLFILLNKIFKRRLHYIVIGGWLPELLKENQKLKKMLSKFNGVYAETRNVIKILNEQYLSNTIYLPNFKKLDIVKEEELTFSVNEPYDLCIFSRVMKQKGIEDAIQVVKSINNFVGRVAYKLDIYGPIDKSYIDEFEKIKELFPKYIEYKGTIDFNESTKYLKKYFALLFPTQFKTEGIPGTIIDAYSAGVPVIASNWNSACEIINDGKTGYIYEFMDIKMFEKILLNILENVNEINNMKKECLNSAKKYHAKTVIEEFIKYL